MEIKFIEDEDFMSLTELTIEMYRSINPEINSFQAINTLIHMVNTYDQFTAIGLYDDSVLVGFVTGYNNGSNIFQFTGIYTINKNSDWTKKLIEYSFDFVKDNNYIAWEVDATSENISSIMEKYGAVPLYTRYRKEL